MRTARCSPILSRGLGVRATLFTLTRGEGGQNAMSADSDDALGIIRTNELLRADEFYGAKQLWGTEVDFGFSKTQEEAFAQWGHDRVLYDAVLAVRRERPQIIVSTFVGGITDGHGQHQVSGEIAQEVFKAAADPKVFPEQLQGRHSSHGSRWRCTRMVPFAPVTEKGMFDYATGKWAPAKFTNYVTGEWITGVPSTDVTIPVGTSRPDARPQLRADCARGMGRTEVAERRRQSHPERTCRGELSLVGRRAGGHHANGRSEQRTTTSFTTKVSTSTPASRAWPGCAGEAPEWLTPRSAPDRRRSQTV